MMNTNTRTAEQIAEEIASHYREIIRLLGEDPEREGLQKTPLRAAKAMMFATQGYNENPEAIMKQAIFEFAGSKIVIVKDIEFYSLCEHHILPFFGKVSIGYIPQGEMIGLSKLARIVNVFARRLQVQERLTAQICESISKILSTRGVIVKCEAEHLCMKMRGVEKQDSSTSTIEYTGDFADVPELRREFFDLLQN